jgi:GT2 family glycosyltransferase
MSRFPGKAEPMEFAREIEIVRNSPMLNPDWYRQTYPDLRDISLDVARHYVEHGAREGRNPHPDFDTRFYLAKYPDVAGSGMNPLVHYILCGAEEGRSPHPGHEPRRYSVDDMNTAARRRLMTDVDLIAQSDLFDPQYYLDNNSDVRSAKIDPVYHYVASGWKEGRQPSALFDAIKYLRDNPDVRENGVNPLTHWLRIGRSENRRFPHPCKHSMSSFENYCGVHEIESQYTKEYDDKLLISVITPTYNIDAKYLSELMISLKNQRYTNWEWIIVDDGSANPDTITKLKAMKRSEPRLTVIFSSRRGISVASNIAVSLAKGTHVALVDHDDVLSRDAFFLLWQHWKKQPDTELFYTDECKLSESYELYDFFHKPAWSPSYLENTMYIGHLNVYKADVLRRVGGFRSQFDGTQDFDLALRVSEIVRIVCHIPSICYFWRAIAGSTASQSANENVLERQKAAVLEHARKRNPAADVRAGWTPGFWTVDFPLDGKPPLVSYVVPTAAGTRTIRGADVDLLQQCIMSLEQTVFYPRREFIVVHNGDLTPQQQSFLSTIEDVVLVEYRPKGCFNLSEKLNLGVACARGDYVCLINDDVEVITPNGGARMIGFLESHPEVGAIAPLCLFEDGRIQHNGIILTATGPMHSGIFKEARFAGHRGHLRCRREAFAISGALLFVRKARYQAVGGFDEAFSIHYGSVDFCLKLRAQGLSCIVDPDIVVHHFASSGKTRIFGSERESFCLKWPEVFDPYFNENFVQSDPYYELPSSDRPQLERIDDHPSLFESWLDSEICRRNKIYHPTGRYKLTVGVTIFNQHPDRLNESLRSITMQTYKNMELVVVDDASTEPSTIQWIGELERRGIATIIKHVINMGAVGTNRSVVAAMKGDFLLFLDDDDYLAIDALAIVAHYIEAHPDACIFYSDEMNTDASSRRFNPFFKPDFDPILLTNFCYPTHLVAIQRRLLTEIEAYSDDRAAWRHDYDTLTRALARGIKPIHVPELLYASRIYPGSIGVASDEAQTIESQRFILERLLMELGKDGLLGIEPNGLFSQPGMWRLSLKGTIPPVEVIYAPPEAANGVEESFHALLVAAHKVDGPEWIAILADAADREGVLSRLFEVALFDSDVVAVSGIVINKDDQTVRWAGGVFTSESTVMSVYFGTPINESGYQGQLHCQRCVDVAAPINILLRKDFIHQTLLKFGSADYLSFLVALGIQAALSKKYIAITPHVRHVTSDGEMWPVPDDRAGLLEKISELGAIGRWYNPRLPSLASQAYQIIRNRDAQAIDFGKADARRTMSATRG